MSLVLVRSMGVASLGHNGIHTRSPWKSDSGPLRFFSPSSIRAQIRSSVLLSHQLRSSCAVSCSRCSRNRRTHFTPIAFARRTEQDEDISTSEETERTSFESSDVINSDDNASNTFPSVGTPGGKIQGPDHGYISSIRTVVLCVSTAVAFGFGVGLMDGVGKASEFFAGYLLEQSLSVDNLFVFVLIFKYFKVPTMYQSRVLTYGIAGAIIFRLSLILLGTTTLQRFEAVNLLLAVILLYSSFKLFTGEEGETDLSNNFIVKTCQKFIPVTSDYDGDRFITIQDGVWKATPLLLTVAVIELSDIAFAVDSIPAVLGVTRDPFIVLTSNLFAILGLRSLYTLISQSMSELEYLQPAISIVLGFIGSKMILDFFGYHVSTEVSLGCVATCLGGGVLLSLMRKSE
ncbi:hypothetical protein NE237_004295 [Protea cynaroides]|uniref:Thylakoid membrane protein TERC, chloroplastic n=1 Tax=Protea cynaroides TaxID=273540 RepID=A0A9Q0KJ65_9MAGN|nr:hypothetical protein NE237_004295 [Protea cynaroides]